MSTESIALAGQSAVGRRVSYTRMEDTTAEDCALNGAVWKIHSAGAADRLLEYLPLLKGSANAEQVDRYEHSLQTATRALRDGAEDELVVAALFHDIGDILAPSNHSECAASLLRPFVSRTTHWIVKHHGLFQGYYYLHLQGKDRNLRDRLKDHPAYQKTVDFCHKWDQTSFDPSYDTLPISVFEPIVRRVFARKPWSVEGPPLGAPELEFHLMK